MKAELLEYILGNNTLTFFIAFYFFALLGVVFSMLLHYKNATGKKAEKQPFNWGFWLKDNLIRLATSIISIYLVVRFYEYVPIEAELNMFLGLLVGASLDQVIIFFRNKTKISIFQTSK